MNQGRRCSLDSVGLVDGVQLHVGDEDVISIAPSPSSSVAHCYLRSELLQSFQHATPLYQWSRHANTSFEPGFPLRQRVYRLPVGNIMIGQQGFEYLKNPLFAAYVLIPLGQIIVGTLNHTMSSIWDRLEDLFHVVPVDVTNPEEFWYREPQTEELKENMEQDDEQEDSGSSSSSEDDDDDDDYDYVDDLFGDVFGRDELNNRFAENDEAYGVLWDAMRKTLVLSSAPQASGFQHENLTPDSFVLEFKDDSAPRRLQLTTNLTHRLKAYSVFAPWLRPEFETRTLLQMQRKARSLLAELPRRLMLFVSNDAPLLNGRHASSVFRDELLSLLNKEKSWILEYIPNSSYFLALLTFWMCSKSVDELRQLLQDIKTHQCTFDGLMFQIKLPYFFQQLPRPALVNGSLNCT